MSKRPSLEEQIERAERDYATKLVRLKALKKRETLQQARLANLERKAETRRLILLGRLLEEWMKKDPVITKKVRRRLGQWLDKPQDRELFGLRVEREP